MNLEILPSDFTYLNKLKDHLNALRSRWEQDEISLYEAIVNSDGAYPLDVLNALQLAAIPFIEDEFAFILKDNFKVRPKYKGSNSDDLFADPHPADYDWRFDGASISLIVDYISRQVDSKSKIGLLGTKTLYPTLVEYGYLVTLFNKSSSLLDDLRKAGYRDGLVNADLIYPLDKQYRGYSLVVADPPWYDEYYISFLSRSYELLQEDGILLLSVLPRLSRPSAEEDRARIQRVAYELGFTLISSFSNKLSYKTPFFEYNSLVEKQLYCHDWRLGDLWIFKKTHKANSIEIKSNEDNILWQEFYIQNKKIKIKCREEKVGAIFRFDSADPNGFILTHVSRRTPIRKNIDIWTSDNLAFKVDRVSLFVDFLKAWEKGMSKKEIKNALEKEQNITADEWNELLRLIKLIFESKARQANE